MFLYSKKTLEHFYNPKHVGQIHDSQLHALSGWAGDKAQGNIINIQLSIDEDGIIHNAAFKAQGTVGLIASGSWFCDSIIKQTLSDAKNIDCDVIAEQLELPEQEFSAAMMVEDAFLDAIS